MTEVSTHLRFFFFSKRPLAFLEEIWGLIWNFPLFPLKGFPNKGTRRGFYIEVDKELSDCFVINIGSVDGEGAGLKSSSGELLSSAVLSVEW